MNSFYIKYLKYKKKYLKNKKQVGGMRNVKVVVKGKSFILSLPERVFCRKSNTLFVEPYLDSDGKTYEKTHIHDLQSKLEAYQIRKNFAMLQTVEELLDNGYNKKEEEIRKLQEKAENGNAQAQFELALKYHSGEDFLEKNNSEAIELLRSASSVGHPEAITFLQRIELSSEPRMSASLWMPENGGMAASLWDA